MYKKGFTKGDKVRVLETISSLEKGEVGVVVCTGDDRFIKVYFPHVESSLKTWYVMRSKLKLIKMQGPLLTDRRKIRIRRIL